MSIKKRFTIAPDLASGLRNSIQSASANLGQLHYDMMSLDIIERDPKNPRQLQLSFDEMLNGINKSDSDYAVKLKEREALIELSESVKKIGIKNAIEVYKDGVKYRIITGERRYWAAMLAQQKSVPVRISQKPDEFHLRYTQWVENINRQDLSLWEKLNNLLLMADAYMQSRQQTLTEEVIQKLLGVSSIQAYRYSALLKADDKLVKLIQLGKLNNLKLVQQLVTMKDLGARNQMIAWIFSSKDEVTSLAAYKLVAGKTVRSALKTEKPIQLGKVKNQHIAKQLIKIALSDERLEKHRHIFQSIDWSSSVAIKRAFQDLFKKIESEFTRDEMVVW